MAATSANVLSSHLYDIIDIGFGRWAKLEPLLARTACIALQRLSADDQKNLLTSHSSRVFGVLDSLITMEEIKHTNIANQPRVDATNVASEPSSMIDAHSDKDRHDEIEYKSHRKESVLISVSDLQDLKMILKKKLTNTECLFM